MTETEPTAETASGQAPTITVAMPVFNAGRHLRLAVLSIVHQTFADWELLIIDDGSTDGSVQHISDIQDRRIQILSDGRNKGLAARLNEAIDLARGPYFARMDQDDVSYPERFASQLDLLENKPKLDVVAVRAIAISHDNECLGIWPGPLSHEQICIQPWKGFYFPHPTWMGHTRWFRTHRYASPGPFFCEDQELLLRSYVHSRFETVEDILFGYRVRERTNWKKQVKTRWTLFDLQRRYFTQSGKFRFALLSLLITIGRSISDSLQVIRHSPGTTHYAHARNDPIESSNWKNILGQVLVEPRSKK